MYFPTTDKQLTINKHVYYGHLHKVHKCKDKKNCEQKKQILHGFQ